MEPLTGKRVLITRPAGQSAGLARLVQEAGGEPVCIPTIEIRALEDPAPFRTLAARLDSFDLAIFVSRNAVRSALGLLGGKPWPDRLAVATVGQGSREELEQRGFTRVIAPEAQSDSEALLALPQLAGMQGRRVVIFRGDAGRQLIGEELQKRGAIVEYAACYRRVRPAGEGLAAAWAQGIHAVTLSSAEGLQNLVGMLGSEALRKLAAVALFVPHVRVASAAERLGLRHTVVAGPRDAEMAAALAAYFGGAR